MSTATEQLLAAQKHALSTRPKIGGFPYMAEVLKQAGVEHNIWSLPSCQSVYLMKAGNVVMQGTPLVTGVHTIPAFDREALIKSLRTDQAGESTFPEFLQAAWQAGVINYDVNFIDRKVTYCGAQGETYIEAYPEVTI
jgi:uncharacterized protein YbcV (DUF1398 family)